MQRSRLRGNFVASLAIVAGMTATCLAGDASGTWKWKFTPPNGEAREVTLTLKQDGEKLSGSISMGGGQGRSRDIQNGSIKNDEVAFETTFERNGNTATSKYKGKLSGDTIKGKIERERNGQSRSTDWEATRSK